MIVRFMQRELDNAKCVWHDRVKLSSFRSVAKKSKWTSFDLTCTFNFPVKSNSIIWYLSFFMPYELQYLSCCCTPGRALHNLTAMTAHSFPLSSKWERPQCNFWKPKFWLIFYFGKHSWNNSSATTDLKPVHAILSFTILPRLQHGHFQLRTLA